MTIIKKITIRVKGKKRTFYPTKMLRIKGKILEKELMEQANLLFFWERQRDKAKAFYREKLTELIELRSELYLGAYEHFSEEARDDYVDSKKCTAGVEVNPDVIHLQKFVNRLQADVDTLQSIVDAIKERGQIMRTLLYKERNYEG